MILHPTVLDVGFLQAVVERFATFAPGEKTDREGILLPQAVYGYFPCQAEGDDLVIYTDLDGSEERCRFTFPRQTAERKRCISDFFRPAESGAMDVVAFQVATVGQKASDYARELFAKDNYKEYLYLHITMKPTTDNEGKPASQNDHKPATCYD